MSKTYFVTYLEADEGEKIEEHHNLTEVKKSVAWCFERNHENIVVYEAREMDINIDISISTKKELPF